MTNYYTRFKTLHSCDLERYSVPTSQVVDNESAIFEIQEISYHTPDAPEAIDTDLSGCHGDLEIS